MKNYRYNSPMKDLRGYLTNDEMDRIELAAKNSKVMPDRCYLIIRLMRVTGRRVSEILNLKPSDIDFENGQIRWQILKKRGDEPLMRIKWIDKITLRDLRIYVKHYNISSDTRLFNLKRQGVWKMVRRLGKKAGVWHIGDGIIHPHLFRHSFSINYLRKHKGSSMALKELQDILEHSSLELTSVYLQFSNEDMKKNYEVAIADDVHTESKNDNSCGDSNMVNNEDI